MKYLVLTICLCLTLNAMAYVKKTCTCYTGWACYGNDSGGSSCTNTGYSWSQSGSGACSSSSALDGTVTTVSWNSYSAGAGQPYSSPVQYEYMTGGSGADINCN